MSPTRVLVADDQTPVHGVLATFLGLESDLKIVTQAGRGDEILDTVRKHTVDVALVDINMLGRDGLTATAEVIGSDLPCRYLIVTAFSHPGYLSRGVEAGTADFIVKDTPPGALAETVRKVHTGLRVIGPEFAQESVLLGSNPLTEREEGVLLAAATGTGARGITTRLSLGEGTVRSYLSSAIAETHAHNRTEVACAAETNDWL